MSYGTRKAIAGTIKGTLVAADQCNEAVIRFNACITREQIKQVLAWAKRSGGWFLRSNEDDARLRQAYDAACKRAAHPPDASAPETRK